MNKSDIERKLLDFINNNDLDFSGTGSDLNSNCCVLAGYSLWLEISKSQINTFLSDHEVNYLGMRTEFTKVYYHAKVNKYGDFWETEEARNSYTF